MTDRPVLTLTPHDRQAAAARIFEGHTPEQVADVITWAEPDIAERLRLLQARFSTRTFDVRP